MLFPCALAQFEAALAALKNVATVTETTPTTGSVVSSKVDFGYGFNGTSLMLTITAKHGAAKFVADSVIYAHIQDDLMQVKA